MEDVPPDITDIL